VGVRTQLVSSMSQSPVSASQDSYFSTYHLSHTAYGCVYSGAVAEVCSLKALGFSISPGADSRQLRCLMRQIPSRID
jgi:hypothetical protein